MQSFKKQATQSYKEWQVQCVAQTCLEKRSAKNQIYGRCKGDEKEGNKMDGGDAVCFTVWQRGRSQDRRVVSQATNPRPSRGVDVLPHWDYDIIPACKVRSRPDSYRGNTVPSSELTLFSSGNSGRPYCKHDRVCLLADPPMDSG